MAGTKESDGLYLMALFWALKNERSPKVYRALVHDTLIERGAWRISGVRMGLTGSARSECPAALTIGPS